MAVLLTSGVLCYRLEETPGVVTSFFFLLMIEKDEVAYANPVLLADKRFRFTFVQHNVPEIGCGNVCRPIRCVDVPYETRFELLILVYSYLRA